MTTYPTSLKVRVLKPASTSCSSSTREHTSIFFADAASWFSFIVPQVRLTSVCSNCSSCSWVSVPDWALALNMTCFTAHHLISQSQSSSLSLLSTDLLLGAMCVNAALQQYQLKPPPPPPNPSPLYASPRRDAAACSCVTMYLPHQMRPNCTSCNAQTASLILCIVPVDCVLCCLLRPSLTHASRGCGSDMQVALWWSMRSGLWRQVCGLPGTWHCN